MTSLAVGKSYQSRTAVFSLYPQASGGSVATAIVKNVPSMSLEGFLT